MKIGLAVTVLLVMLLATPQAAAHCDAVDGPVVNDARLALARADVTPVLKWVHAKEEPEIRAAFARTLTARATGDDARQVADQWFFETLVRLHREGEGESFKGLRPVGWKPPEAVTKADEALAKGSVESLEALLETTFRTELRERFVLLLRAREHRNESVDAGRRYVAAYAEFMHYVERLATSPHEEGANDEH